MLKPCKNTRPSVVHLENSSMCATIAFCSFKCCSQDQVSCASADGTWLKAAAPSCGFFSSSACSHWRTHSLCAPPLGQQLKRCEGEEPNSQASGWGGLQGQLSPTEVLAEAIVPLSSPPDPAWVCRQAPYLSLRTSSWPLYKCYVFQICG